MNSATVLAPVVRMDSDCVRSFFAHEECPQHGILHTTLQAIRSRAAFFDRIMPQKRLFTARKSCEVCAAPIQLGDMYREFDGRAAHEGCCR